MQVILGSGGAVGRPLAQALSRYTGHILCCSRTSHPLPSKNPATYEHRVTDLLRPETVRAAVQTAEVVYLTVGLPYRRKIWARDWLPLIENVIVACAGKKLVFFDNVYSLDPAEYGRMTEASRVAPASEKGRIRRQVVERLWAAHHAGHLQLAVARAADFYGPGVESSLLNALVLDKLTAGGTPMWIGPTLLPHSFTYTPDAGRHLALLGNDDRAWGHTWHLPTARSPWTIAEWVERAGEVLGTTANVRALPRWLFWTLGRFNADLAELYEVREQFLRPYRFDSGLFESTFGVKATNYGEGLMASLRDSEALKPN